MPVGDTLKLEARFEMGLAHTLREWGHEVEILDPFDEAVGHAGAIVSGSSGTAQAKKEALEAAGVRVGKTPSETARLMHQILAH